MKIRLLAGFLSAILASTAVAQTLVQNTGALAYTTNLFVGQSFLTPNDATHDLLTGFTWLNTSNVPFGAGQLYVYDQAYSGTPSNLASGTGLLGVSNTYSGSSYSFSTTIDLAPNATYWVYTSTAQQVGITFSNTYADGDTFSAANSGAAYGLYSGGSMDATFAVTATAVAVPEPSTYAMLAGVAALGLAAWRRRMTPQIA